MFATNFIIKNDTLKFTRGEDNISKFNMQKKIETGHNMENNFCKTCGSLMFRVSSGFPGKTIMRLGQVDDFALHEGKLKPTIEQYAKDRVAWVQPAVGVEQHAGGYYR
ncbi:MAG: hypothetical protein Q9220_003913 [cf. Caloplaca sp. 1 TL-2023]